MARYSFQGTFRDGQGNIISGGTITVYLAGTDTQATVYADDTTVTSTYYVESDDNGYFIFYVDDSDYSSTQLFDIQLSKTGYETKLYPDIAVLPETTTDENITVTDNTTNNASASAHGWMPKLSNDATQYIDGTGTWANVTDADLSITDVTTNNSSTTKHGFLKKLSDTTTQFMDGTGEWDTIKDADIVFSDVTTNDVSTTKHGFVPKLPDNSAQFLNGTGSWTTPSGGGGGGITRQTVLSAVIDSNGKPTFISVGTGLAVNIDASPTPVRIAFAAGFGASGAVNYVGTIDEDTSISSLTASSINYLYAERNPSTGAITLGKVTVMPVYAYSAPSHASGQYWYSIAEGIMYLSNGSDTWTAQQVVFLGEAVTNVSSVTSVVNYALAGRYDSGYTNNLPANAATISFSHNIGVRDVDVMVILKCISAEAGYLVDDQVEMWMEANGSEYAPRQIVMRSRNVAYWQRASSGLPAMIAISNGNRSIAGQNNWAYKIVAKRRF